MRLFHEKQIHNIRYYISGGRGGPMRGQPPYGRGPGGYNRDPYPPPPPPSYMRDRMDGYVSFEVQIITLGDKIRKKIEIFFPIFSPL